jgi:hypothetical protein
MLQPMELTSMGFAVPDSEGQVHKAIEVFNGMKKCGFLPMPTAIAY